MVNNINDTYECLEETYIDISKEHLSLNASEIESALIKHTSTYAFFASVLSYAKKKLDTLEMKLELGEAKYMEIRRVELLKGGQKATQGALNTYVLTVPELIKMREENIECQHKYSLSRNIVSSLDHQKDMLVQLSANRRAEAKLHEL